MNILTMEKIANLKSIAQDILDEKIDFVDGFRELERYKDAIEDSDAWASITGICDDTDHLILGDINKHFSENFLENQKKWKQEYAKDMWPYIKQVCKEIVNLYKNMDAIDQVDKNGWKLPQ